MGILCPKIPLRPKYLLIAKLTGNITLSGRRWIPMAAAKKAAAKKPEAKKAPAKKAPVKKAAPKKK
jgi:hypothetical protein